MEVVGTYAKPLVRKVEVLKKSHWALCNHFKKVYLYKNKADFFVYHYRRDFTCFLATA